jgi:hypothetical protein
VVHHLSLTVSFVVGSVRVVDGDAPARHVVVPRDSSMRAAAGELRNREERDHERRCTRRERGRGSRELPRVLRSMLLSAGEAATGLGASTLVVIIGEKYYLHSLHLLCVPSPSELEVRILMARVNLERFPMATSLESTIVRVG